MSILHISEQKTIIIIHVELRLKSGLLWFVFVTFGFANYTVSNF